MSVNANVTVKQVSLTRDQLKPEYEALLRKNPLLARIEAQTANVGWSAEEIRAFQLIVAVASNASLQQRIMELEQTIEQMVASKAA